MTDELIGQRIGGYEILDEIGRGGMATVFRAQQVSMNRIVAIKVLPRQFLNDDTYLQRFNREVRIISRLEHRNIVPVHDYGEHNGQPYIVMRYMSGGSVDDLLAHGPLPFKQIASIVSQIAPALDYAHSKHVLHRDIKPSNVLMDDGGGAYLTDFGIARIMSENTNIGITTQGVVGTPSYMSPEQAQGQEIDGRSDIYALGVMLFEMATGRRPFESDTPYSIAVMQVTQPPPPPRSLNPEIPPALEQVIYRALSKRREERYPNAVSLAEAIQAALSAPVPPTAMADTHPGGVPLPPPAPSAVPAYYPPPTSGKAQPVRRRQRGGSVLISAAVGGAIGCGLLALLVAAVIVSNAQLEEAALIERLTATAEPRSPIPSVTPLPGLLEGDLEGRPTESPNHDAEASIAPIGVRSTATPPVVGGIPDARIVFFAERGGNFDLYRMDLRTREEVRLTTDPGIDMYPQVSPDGRQIVFVSSRDGDYELFLMDASGGGLRQLTFNDVTERIPSWSPDGRWIIYSSDTRGDGSHDLYQIRPDGSEQTVIYSDGLRNSHPRWSRDDRYIIFTGGEPENGSTWNIMRLERGSGAAAALTNNGVRDWSPVFAPDGSHIIYLTVGNGEAALMTMGLDGSGQRLLYDGPGYEWGALYSPDMQYLIFTSDVSGRDELYLMEVESRAVRQLTNMGGMYADWLVYNGS